MNKHPETESIYNKIKDDMELPEEALAALGLTREDIDARLDEALKFMSKEQAVKSILTIWKHTS